MDFNLSSSGGRLLQPTQVQSSSSNLSSEQRRSYGKHDGIQFISKAPQGRYFTCQTSGKKVGRTTVNKASVTKLLNDYLFTTQLIIRAFPTWQGQGNTIIQCIGFALWEISFYDDSDVIKYTELWRKEIHDRYNVYRGNAKKALKFN